MKKVTLLLISFHLILFTVDLKSQPCLPEGVTLLTQQDIDNFQTYYPNCTEIEGDVTVGGEFTNITNLNGLNVITSIEGNLEIVWNDNLANLSGLNNLTFIGGDFVVMKNDILTSLIGLENMNSIGGKLKVGHYINGSTGHDWGTFLTSFTGLNNLTSIGGNLEVINNYALTSFTGLDNVVYIGGDIYIDANLILSSLSGLENLHSLEGGIEIGGGVPLQSGNPSLMSLSGLDNLSSIGEWLRIDNNDSMTNFMGLTSLNSIGGELWITDNDALISLSGLENLTSIEGDLSIGATSSWVSGNHSLISLSGLINLVSIEGALQVHDNIILTSLSGLDNIEESTINFISISNNVSLSNCHIQSICDHLVPPGGSVIIQDNAPGCNSPNEVIAACDSVQTSIWKFSDKNTLTISPNPISSTFVIEYFLHRSSLVTIKILNVNGQVITTLVNEQKQLGKQNLVFDGTGLKPGIYFCVFRTNPPTGGQTSKMIKL